MFAAEILASRALEQHAELGLVPAFDIIEIAPIRDSLPRTWRTLATLTIQAELHFTEEALNGLGFVDIVDSEFEREFASIQESWTTGLRSNRQDAV
jgi:hypothetical protein